MIRLTIVVAVGAFLAATSASAQQTPAGDGGCVVPATLDTWQLPASEAHGVHQLPRTTTIALPTGVPSLDVELWGAGGGGGAGSVESISEGGYGGGGGASGAYARMAVPTGGTRELTLIVGRGGEGGRPQPAHTDGQDGGSTAICQRNRALALVAGGAGGRAGHANKSGGEGGKAAQSGGTDGLRKPGNAGATGNAPLFDLRGSGGAGGAAVAGSVQPPAASGGVGGLGASTAQAPGAGTSGADGYAIVRW